MRVLLVSPKVWLKGYSALFSETDEIGLGLLYLAAATKAQGHECRAVVSDDTRIKAVISEYVPDVIGITAITCTYPMAVAIAREVKSLHSGMPIVMGGHHVTFTVRQALAESCIDYIVRGDGEEAFPGLLANLERGDPFPSIPGVCYQRDGTIHNADTFARVGDLDGLPFPDQGLLQNPGRALVIASRGCPHRCNFCSVPAFHRRTWRRRSVLNILDELEVIARTRKLTKVEFRDDNLVADPRWTRALCLGIRERGFRFTWHCQARTDALGNDPGLLDLMKASGCSIIGLGLESGMQEIVDSYGKGTSVQQALHVSALLRERSILQIWYSMIGSGDDLDTPYHVKRNVASLASFPFDLLQVSLLTPCPGTPLYDKLEREGRLLGKGWEYYDGVHCVYQPAGMSAQHLEGELVRAYQSIFIGSGAKRLLHTLVSARGFLFHTVSLRKLIKILFKTLILRKNLL
jgi:anaerobic magnesium-protoporphyrin IX monomethyl ester cyclase